MAYQPSSESDVFSKCLAVSRKKVCLLHTHHTIYHNLYSMVGWSIASISDLGGIFTSAL